MYRDVSAQNKTSIRQRIMEDQLSGLRSVRPRCACGQRMVLKHGRHGPFFGCEYWEHRDPTKRCKAEHRHGTTCNLQEWMRAVAISADRQYAKYVTYTACGYRTEYNAPVKAAGADDVNTLAHRFTYVSKNIEEVLTYGHYY
jgi:ssDNA-binding Zn-finger/Zn-ribbon topoisomerase 1